MSDEGSVTIIQQKGMTATEREAYLKLDQTTHQHVINDAPRFDGDGSNTPSIIFKSGTRIVFDGT